VKNSTPPILKLLGPKEPISVGRYDAVALAAGFTENGPSVEATKIALTLATEFSLDFSQILSQWPEFSGKAGELIELPLTGEKCKRLFIIGVGEERPADLRKAGVTLGRRVKGKSLTVFNGIITSPKSAVVHLNALSLSQYMWSKRSEKEEKKLAPCTFVLSGKIESEVNHSRTLVEAVWLARNLIHETSDEKIQRGWHL